MSRGVDDGSNETSRKRAGFSTINVIV